MNDDELMRRIKYQVASIKEFVPNERDLMARIARARKPSPWRGITAALGGASAALLMVLTFPAGGPGIQAPTLEDEVIESFGSALTGEETLGWGDLTEVTDDETKEGL